MPEITDNKNKNKNNTQKSRKRWRVHIKHAIVQIVNKDTLSKGEIMNLEQITQAYEEGRQTDQETLARLQELVGDTPPAHRTLYQHAVMTVAAWIMTRMMG